jgi:alanyl-tRNA synthetase
MTSSAVRSSFLEFFARHHHRIVPSSSLVPADDPTLLFTNAGMNQFKDVFLGKERRDYTRATSSQKCMRVSGKHNDLENVGPSLRHHTFFEMLGNFSFGDYFKADAIDLAWRLLTEEWKLPADRLHATIFGGEGGIPRDEESGRIWRQFLPADRVAELGLADNFWSMGDTGPCGRCSEIHYFRGADLPCPEPVCLGVACSCDRFVEVWNNVFMEFDRHANGLLAPLPAPSIDTGMGLERVTAVLQDVLSNYATDLFTGLLAALGELARVRYGGTMDPRDVSMRVVADHTRAMTFLIGDGVVPSNEWRGYVLRKIMRRAMRHGKRLGMTEPFLFRLVGVMAREMGDAYPELKRQHAYIEQLVRSEEERFESVLISGLPRLEEVLERATAAGRGVVPGDEAFRLYDTYGVPRDFIEDLAGERHLALDLEGFERAMEGQREKARAQSTFGGAKAEALTTTPEIADALRAAGDQFEGYTTTRVAGVPILAILDERGQPVSELREDDAGYLALARTPFYMESGGQVSDAGTIFTESGSGRATVEALTRVSSDQARLHRVRVTAGVLRERDLVTAEVDRELRNATRRNHTATHLLHAALRRVLGRHVKQAGSLVAPDRLRFDFLHFAAVSRDELDEIERLVNEQIYLNTTVETEVRATEQAIAAGAMALFGEKYGDHVRVVSVPGFSLELCGGTHCRSTGDIGFLTIVQEGGIAAGTRRIEALTGGAAVRHHQEQRRALAGILQTLNTPADQAVEVIEHLEAEVKRLGRENSQLKVKLAMGRSAVEAAGSGEPARTGLQPVEESIGGAKIRAERVDGLDKASLRALADSHRDRLKSGVVVLASAEGGKVAIVVSVTKDLTGRVHAGQIVRQIAPIVGGGGGGRPDFAEAGGKTPEKIGEMLEESRRLVRQMLGA